MALINLSLEHKRTRPEARKDLEKAVEDVRGLMGPMLRRVEWSEDLDRVRLEGPGFWVEMTVNDRHVHATGDLPSLAGLLGGPAGGLLKKVLERRFPPQLT